MQNGSITVQTRGFIYLQRIAQHFGIHACSLSCQLDDEVELQRELVMMKTAAWWGDS